MFGQILIFKKTGLDIYISVLKRSILCMLTSLIYIIYTYNTYTVNNIKHNTYIFVYIYIIYCISFAGWVVEMVKA